jgi:DNA sulfur modification protein DndB
VPKKVRLEVGTRFENDDGKRGAKEAYFELMDYRRIALDKWEMFGPILGYGESGNKEKRTKWMQVVNEKRNLVAHPSSGVAISLEELAELAAYEQWLKQSIAGTAHGANGSSAESEGVADDVEAEAES